MSGGAVPVEVPHRASDLFPKRASVDTTMFRLRSFFAHPDLRFRSITESRSLRVTEARSWMACAIVRAEGGEDGAVAALVALLMGLRAGEIVSRVARDVDDGGRLLWIPDSKTEAGKRTQQVPAVLRPHLLRLTDGLEPHDLIFGGRKRAWPRLWVKRICREARVPEVTAHGMRGLHSTLAIETGVTAHAVAAALGHESPTTTFQHYATSTAVGNARQKRALAMLEGGR